MNPPFPILKPPGRSRRTVPQADPVSGPFSHDASPNFSPNNFPWFSLHCFICFISRRGTAVRAASLRLRPCLGGMPRGACAAPLRFHYPRFSMVWEAIHRCFSLQSVVFFTTFGCFPYIHAMMHKLMKADGRGMRPPGGRACGAQPGPMHPPAGTGRQKKKQAVRAKAQTVCSKYTKRPILTRQCGGGESRRQERG